jgi:hypothetical protein
MWRLRKVMLIAAGTIAGLAAAGAAAWLYVTNNLEQPAYATVISDDTIEIRDYPALVMAEVTRRGDRNSAVRAGFSPLAAYIFAKDRSGESISMTAPVLQQRQPIAMTSPVLQTLAGSTATGRDSDGWIIRFIMPARYTLTTLPKAAGDDMRLLEVPAGRKAAIRFSGVATDELIARQEAILRGWLTARKIAIDGLPNYAYYNDPFTPGPLRRNEVLFDVTTTP